MKHTTTKILARTAMAAALAASALFAGTATAADSASLSSQDRDFIMKAAQAGNAEVATGQLAQTNSTSQDVKGFGQEMIRDHGAAGADLARIAKRKGVDTPAQPDNEHLELISKLQSMQGTEFEKRYIRDAGVKDHRDAVALFEMEANSGTDPDLRAFASKTLPTIRHHYEMSKQMAKSMGVDRVASQ